MTALMKLLIVLDQRILHFRPAYVTNTYSILIVSMGVLKSTGTSKKEWGLVENLKRVVKTYQ